jgi:hypothetical protein
MNKTEFLKMALEKLTAASNYIDTLGGVSKGYRMDIERLKAALEAKDEPAPVAKNEGGRITWMIDDWPQNCLLYTHPPQSFTYEQVKAHIRAASMSANDISVGSDTTEDGVSIVIRRRDELLYAEFFAYTPPQRKPCGLECDCTDVCKQEAKDEPVAHSSAWFALVMNAAAELEDASHCLRDEDAKQVAIRGAKYYREQAHALYTTPPQQEAKDEPVAYLPPTASPDNACYTPPQRTWVGLTDEEIEVIEVLRAPPVHPDFVDCDDWVEFARAIENKLRELNT